MYILIFFKILECKKHLSIYCYSSIKISMIEDDNLTSNSIIYITNMWTELKKIKC